MKKLSGKSFDIIGENINKLGEIFPELVTEGKVDINKLSILFDKTQNKIYEDYNDEYERYEFSWTGKKEALRLAQKQTSGTLRPCKEESVYFDETKNLYIEGDNLEVLRTLQSSYRGRIKMIYIDPPYNTGKDFVYKDNFNDNIQNYKEMTNESFKTNTDTSGRFHTNWLNMIYPRLKLAKNLLTEDGVIFISLDDNEVTNSRKICDEIFGEDNFVEQLIWKRRATPPNDRVIGKNHEYVLVYSKNISQLKLYLQPRSEELNSRYKNPDNDPRGRWVASDLSANGKGGRLTESCIYGIKNPKSAEEYYPPNNKCWLYNKEKMDQLILEGRIGFRENSGAPFLKRYLSEVRDGSTLPTIIDNGGFSQDSARELKSIFEKDVFEFPKPISLLKILLTAGCSNEDIVLDFFSGSCSTAQAIMELNIENNNKVKFIMVQIPEQIEENSEAYKAGYKNICEIGRERIRRTGLKLIDKNNKNKSGIVDIDIGFKVLKLDSTNLSVWDDSIREVEEFKQMVWEMNEPIKKGRTQEDVIYEILLKYGVDLTMPIEYLELMGSKVFSVGFGYLMVCLEKDISLDLIEAIAEQKPNSVVLYDNGLNNESKINGDKILKSYGVQDIRTI